MIRRPQTFRRRHTAEGAYTPNAFSIRIESDPPLIDPVTLAVRADSPEDFSTLVHEYWHYLQNLTTVAGFTSYVLYQDLLALFSRTLLRHGDGRSAGSGSLGPNDRQAVGERTAIYLAREGQDGPDGFDPDAARDFEVVDVALDEYALTRDGQEIPLGRVRLTVRATLDDGTSAQGEVLFGQFCVEEGVAYEVDRMVAAGPGGPAEDNAPPFPYLVLRRLARARSAVDVHRTDLVALGTLALMTIDPAVTFLDILDDFGRRRAAGQPAAAALEEIWQALRPHTEHVVGAITRHELPGMLADYAGRGLLLHANQYLAEHYATLLRRRLTDPFFDLRPFLGGTHDRPALERLFREVLPCDTVQVLPGDDDAVARDLLVTFGHPPERWTRLGYRPADFLRTLECQAGYLFAHLRTDGFSASADTKATCPFYSVCALPLRRDRPEVCGRAPWGAFTRGGSLHCWYGTAVAATLGRPELRAMVGDPRVADRERAAVRAAVRERAYAIWEGEGCADGCHLDHWFRAKAELGIADDIHV